MLFCYSCIESEQKQMIIYKQTNTFVRLKKTKKHLYRTPKRLCFHELTESVIVYYTIYMYYMYISDYLRFFLVLG